MIFYHILSFIILPAYLIILLFRLARKKEEIILERFAISPKKPKSKNVFWVHAASVGEAISSFEIVQALANIENSEVLFTSGTLTSKQIINKKFASIANVTHHFLPFDNFFIINKFLNKWHPKLAIFIESEFWPTIINLTSKRCKLISYNSSISDQSLRNWSIFKYLAKKMLSSFAFIMCQSDDDKHRFMKLGIDSSKIEVIPNAKYANPKLEFDHAEADKLKKLFELDGKFVITAASTHNLEEEILLGLFKQIYKQKTFANNLLLIIAPRHIHRKEKIKKIIEKFGFEYSTRSENQQIKPSTQIYIADTLGELGLFYHLSDIAIIGGSFLENIGGHNPLEAAHFSNAIIYGPHYWGFSQICNELKNASAIKIIDNKNHLQTTVEKLLTNQNELKTLQNNAFNFVNKKQKQAQKVINFIKDQATNLTK